MPIWRDPTTRRWLTLALFKETTDWGKNDYVVYTLKDQDDPSGLKSLKRLYLEMEDLTELEFSKKYLGGWTHWKRILSSKELSPYIALWREELEIKLMAKGLKVIKEALYDDTSKMSDRMFAAKFYANRDWEKALKKQELNNPGKKRPKKNELVEKINNLADEDFDRLFEQEPDPKVAN